MADGEDIDITLTIPQFREKTIYYTYEDNDFSYPVSASYRGILRLSPNDDGTLQEQNTLNLLDIEDYTSEMYYQDSIGEAIQTQFLKTSTSDGFFVDFRLDRNQAEFDNLYIIGPGKCDQVKLFSRKDETIILDKINVLPSVINGHYSDDDAKVLIESGNNDTRILDDITDINVHSDQLDQTYVLSSQSLSKRKFRYKQIAPLIKKLIMEALLDLKTIPVGSIHFTPVNLEQYQALVRKGRPNSYWLNGHGYDSDTPTPNDPIVRDYLVCDGSLYRNIDFPELAKILKDEYIVYWDIDSETGRMVKKEHWNVWDSNLKEDEKVFRVPDLRRMFVKSVVLGKSYVGEEWNRTGAWTVDSRPQYETGQESDNHRHYITSALYQPGPDALAGDVAGGVKTSQFTQVADETPENIYYQYSLRTNAAPGVLAPQNGMKEWKGGTYGVWYNTYAFGFGCSVAVEHNNTCGYFLSHPEEYDFANPESYEPNVGKSSEEIVSCVENPERDKDISYNDHSEYVSYVGSDEYESYGMENAPEFYCMLPLIKI